MRDVIAEGMEKAGLEPCVFDKPLKSVGAWYKFKKEGVPENCARRHYLVGWGMGTLIDQFGKRLFNVKSLSVLNDHDGVKIEAVVYLDLLTFEDDHVAFLDSYAQEFAGKDYPSHGYCWTRKFYRWDSVKRIGEVDGYQQMTGDPREGSVMMGRKK